MKLVKRLTLLMRSKLMEKTSVGFLDSAHQYDVVHSLNIGGQNTLLKSLRGMAVKQNNLGRKSASLLNKLQQDFKHC